MALLNLTPSLFHDVFAHSRHEPSSSSSSSSSSLPFLPFLSHFWDWSHFSSPPSLSVPAELGLFGVSLAHTPYSKEEEERRRKCHQHTSPPPAENTIKPRKMRKRKEEEEGEEDGCFLTSLSLFLLARNNLINFPPSSFSQDFSSASSSPLRKWNRITSSLSYLAVPFL